MGVLFGGPHERPVENRPSSTVADTNSKRQSALLSFAFNFCHCSSRVAIEPLADLDRGDNAAVRHGAKNAHGDERLDQPPGSSPDARILKSCGNVPHSTDCQGCPCQKPRRRALSFGEDGDGAQTRRRTARCSRRKMSRSVAASGSFRERYLNYTMRDCLGKQGRAQSHRPISRRDIQTPPACAPECFLPAAPAPLQAHRAHRRSSLPPQGILPQRAKQGDISRSLITQFSCDYRSVNDGSSRLALLDCVVKIMRRVPYERRLVDKPHALRCRSASVTSSVREATSGTGETVR